jgi:copper resistance protein B
MRAALAVLAATLLAPPAAAQHMDHAMMPGMAMPAGPAAHKPKAKAKAAPARKPVSRTRKARPAAKAARPATADPHAGHAMSAMPGMDMASPAPAYPHAGHGMPSEDSGAATPAATDPHAGHAMPAQPTGMAHAGMDMTPAGTDQPAGNAPAPAPQAGLAALRYHDAAAMQAADRRLRREHGGMTYRQLLFNIAEYRPQGDGYRWDGEAWIGGDIHRLTLKSEGEGRFGGRLDRAEVQALYSRALDPYWNVQAGIRQDFGRGPSRRYATVGVEGLAPYWFDVDAALFLSDRGDLRARIAGWHDARITQFLVLQPRAEANVATRTVARDRIGSGLSDTELGLRLRYERSRQLAPYIGVSWERLHGDTARLARARGDDRGGVGFVAGVRGWF